MQSQVPLQAMVLFSGRELLIQIVLSSFAMLTGFLTRTKSSFSPVKGTCDALFS